MNACEYGKSGEIFAAQILKREGFLILAQNFRLRMGEIDLIALKGDRLYFFEIKTYFSHRVAPEERITAQKVLRMQRVAHIYLNRFYNNQVIGCCFELAFT